MDVDLAVDGLRKQSGVSIIDGDAGLVAGGLDAKDTHHA
jgi:hypothetical protein